jgi:hypothetical protein
MGFIINLFNRSSIQKESNDSYNFLRARKFQENIVSVMN